MTKTVFRTLAPALILLTLVGCSQSPDSYIVRGNEFLESGEHEAALLQYRKAIQGDSENGEAYYRLALAHVELEQAAEAYPAMARANELLPEREDIAADFAEFTLALYLSDASRPAVLYERLSDLAAELLENNPDSIPALRVQGFLAALDGRLDEAVERLGAALGAEETDQSTALALAKALFRADRTDEAESFARSWIADHPEQGEMYDVLFQEYRRVGDDSQAAEILEQKVGANPGDAAARIQLAGFYRTTGDTKAVDATLNGFIDAPKLYPDGYERVAFARATFAEWQEAYRVLDAGRESRPDRALDLDKARLKILLAEGDQEAIEPLLRSLRQAHPEDADLQGAYASSLLTSGRADDWAAAKSDFEQLVESHPDNASYRYGLARAIELLGDTDTARTEYQGALKLDPSFSPALKDLAKLEFDRGSFEQSIQYAESGARRLPADGEFPLIVIAAKISAGRLGEAEQELKRHLQLRPGDFDALLQNGRLLSAQRQDFKASSLFSQLFAASGDLRAADGLVAARLRLGDQDGALSAAREALARNPDSPGAMSLLGATATTAGRFELAIDQYERLVELDPADGSGHQQLGLALARAGDTQRALASLRAAEERAPEDDQIKAQLASVLDRTGDREAAVGKLREAVAINPNNPFVNNNLAFMLAEDNKDLDEALRLAVAAQQALPDSQVCSDTVGLVYLKMGKVDAALQVFRGLVASNPGQAVFQHHLGLALSRQGDTKAAREALEAARSLADDPREKASINAALKGLL